jgi:hypothetical protein
MSKSGWFRWLPFLAGLSVVLATQIYPSFSQTNSNPSGQGPTGTTCVLNAIPATSTLVTLTAPSGYITIVNTSATTTLYYSPVSPATTSSFPILPNSAYSYGGVPLSSIYVIGSTNSGNYGLIAH